MTNNQNPYKPESSLEEIPKDTIKPFYLKKEAKKLEMPPQKFYYDVKIETMLPATLTYRILAETAEQAAELIKGKTPNTVQYKLIGAKNIIMRVFAAGSNMIHYIRKL